jgi:hypothetical protein
MLLLFTKSMNKHNFILKYFSLITYTYLICGHVYLHMQQNLKYFSDVSLHALLTRIRPEMLTQFIQDTNFMFCLPCTVIYQYSTTNKMHFLFSVYYELTASTCFGHCLQIQQLVYFVHIMSAGCYQHWCGVSL